MNAGRMTNDPDRQRLNDRQRKLIEMDDRESHDAKNCGWNIMSRGRSLKSWTIFVSMTTPYTHAALYWVVQTEVQKVAYLEYHHDSL